MSAPEGHGWGWQVELVVCEKRRDSCFLGCDLAPKGSLWPRVHGGFSPRGLRPRAFLTESGQAAAAEAGPANLAAHPVL